MDFKEANIWCANHGVSLERAGANERTIILRLGELTEQAEVHEESWNAWKCVFVSLVESLEQQHLISQSQTRFRPPSLPRARPREADEAEPWSERRSARQAG